MNKKSRKSSGRSYALAALIPAFSCLVTIVVAYWWFPDLPGTLGGRISPDKLTQVVVPGSEDVTFAESGAYAVYYEYRSVVDGSIYKTDETPPDLACTLTSKTGAAEIGVVPDHVRTNTYATRGEKRIGVLIGSITVNDPGTYTFSCTYTDGGSHPNVALAIGPNLVWECLGVAARSGTALVTGLVAMVGSGLVTLVITIVIAVTLHRSRCRTLAGKSAQ